MDDKFAALLAGESLLGMFWARAVEPLPADGEAKTEFCFELGQAPHTKLAVWPATLSTEWRRFYVPGDAKVAVAAVAGGIRFRLGYDLQTIEIADVCLLNFGSRVKLADRPFTPNTYRRHRGAPRPSRASRTCAKATSP